MTEQVTSRPGLLSDVFGLASSRALGAAMQAATYVLVARASAPAETGRVLAGLAVATAIMAVLDLGLSSHVMRELGRRALDGDAFADLWTTRVLSAVAGGVVWTLVATVLSPSVVGVGAYLTAESLLAFAVLTAVACQRTRLAGATLLVARTMTLSLVVAFVASASWLPWLLAAGSAVGVALAVYFLRDLGTARTRRPRVEPRLIKETWHYMTSGVLAQMSNLDVPVVAAIAGAQAAGVYGLPSRLTTPLMLVAQSQANLVLPRAAAAWAASDAVGLRLIRRSVLQVSMTCMIPLAGLFAAAQMVVPATLGGEYRDAITPLRIILVAVAIATINGPLIAIMQAIGRSRLVSATLLLAVPLGLLFVAVGAAIDGPVAAGWGLVLMQTLIFTRLWPILSEALRPPQVDLRR